MRNPAKSYAKAVAVLRPSRAEMDRRNAPYHARQVEARAIVDEIVKDTSKTYKEHYHDACARRSLDTPETEAVNTSVRVMLMGLAIRGK